MEIEQNKKIDLKNLSEDARRILFLLVAVPGGKNVAMLREALGLGDAYRQELVNVLTIQLCKELVAARLVKFDKENYGNNSKRVCRLSGPLPMPLLQELASEGSRKNWWPNCGMIYKLCRGVGFRAADSDVKRQYEGQEDLLEGVSNFVRLLLTGEGICIVPSQKIKSGERVQIAFVEHWTTIADPRTDIFAAVGRTRIPLAVMTHALDTLFLKGRDVRPTLAGVVEECLHRIGEVRAYDLFEMSALAVWTGRMDLVQKLNERDWTDPFALRYLDALTRLPDERAVFDLFAELQSYVEKKERSSTVQGAAFSLFTIGVTLRSGQPGPVIARFKRFLDGSMATVDSLKSPLVTENRNHRRYLLSDFRSVDTPYFSLAFERRLYIHCPPADFAKVFASYLFFLSWGKLPRSKLVAVREDLLKTLPTVSITLGCGYPTVAAAMVAVLGPFLDAQTATELVEKVKAAEGLWLWPFVSPEETWQDALAELESLAKPKPRTRNTNADDADEGWLGWTLSFRPLGFSSKGDVFDLATVKPLYVNNDEYGHHQYEEIRPNDVLSHRFDGIRTAQDALILAAYHQRVSITMTPELIDRLVGHPHLFVLEDSRFSRPEPVELVRGELWVNTKVRENGGVELSVPEWMRELSSKDFFHLERPGLYVHYALGDREWKILTVFRDQGVNGVIRVPKDGLDAVAALLPNMASHVRITGAFAPKQEERDGSLPVKSGETQAVARLRFANDVLEIDLGVASSAELPFAVPEVGDAESVRHGSEGLYL